ncbi:A24 family peptidase [Arthrobacter sp. GMC3]|uniref:prepilin peptidase n=1 Tax=Arthrobacter sp. GMC3 TaxID=2058894 RepID=UPI000CE5788B|nr:A24 family peptidase [Arthrobacter sp. GMC3]
MSEYHASFSLIVIFAILGVCAGLAADKGARRLLPELHGQYRLRDAVAASAVTGVLFGGMVWRFGVSWTLPAFLFLAVAGVVLSRIDLAHKLLPNAIVLPSFLVALVLLLVDAAANGRWGNMLLALAGSGVMFVIYLVLAIISPRGMGMGDVKLSAVLGLYLGYLSVGPLVLGMFLGFVVGAVTGGVLVIAGLAGRKSAVPFGPSMVAGALLAVLFGAELGRVLLPALFA